MFVDLILACAHHIAIFVMAGALVAEFVLLRGLLDATPISRLSRADMVYGMSAGAVILIGIGRVLFGLKGWEYYVYNHAFWGKMGVILVVALLSGYPTMRIAAWRKSLATRAWLFGAGGRGGARPAPHRRAMLGVSGHSAVCGGDGARRRLLIARLRRRARR